MIKALFFDIDGTLVSFATHKIPDTAVEALKRAKENGVKIYISTGRPVSFISNLGQIEDLIDGFITTNGAYCYVGNNIVSINAIPQNDVDKLFEICERNHFPAFFVGTKNIAVINKNERLTDVFCNDLNISEKAFTEDINDVLKQPILQISPFFDIDEEEIIMPKIQDCISGRWHEEFTDITSVYADKGKGLMAIAAHEDLLISQCMAFGDGGNDISIIKAAGLGIALGNALPEVKTAADYVTTHIDSDGIANALLHFGVI